MKRRDLVLGLVAVALGGAVLAYHGPGRPFIRGHVGDAAATMFVFAVLGLTSWRLRTRAVVTLTFAFSIELGQLVWTSIGTSGAGALILGSVFDPWDLVAYVVGVVLALTYHRLHDDRREVPGQRRRVEAAR
jgi:hypothetical protein